MNMDLNRDQNLAFLDVHLGNAPIERLLGVETPLHQMGVVIVSREMDVHPQIDVNEPWLDDRSVQALTQYSIEIVRDGESIATVSSLMPAPDQDELMRANVYELLAGDEKAIETLKVYLDASTISQRSRPRFN